MSPSIPTHPRSSADVPSPEAEVPRLLALAQECGVELDTDAVRRLIGYLDLLQRWNSTYNLTSVRRRDEMLVQHLVDCLAVVPAVRRALPHGGRVLDVGSGGGLPGVVLAIALPALKVTCVDTVGKKAAFVRQVSAQLGLPTLQAVHGRVESLAGHQAELICSRAFASLADFVRLTRDRLAPGGVWMAMKGRVPADEIAALPPDVDMFHVEHVRVAGLDAERCLVWMRRREG